MCCLRQQENHQSVVSTNTFSLNMEKIIFESQHPDVKTMITNDVYSFCFKYRYLWKYHCKKCCLEQHKSNLLLFEAENMLL